MNSLTRYACILCLALLALTACRQDPGEKEPEVPFKRTTNSAIIRIDLEPDRLTPLLTTNNSANQVMGNIFMTLETIDPATLEYVALLAKAKPEVQKITEGPYAGGLSYTFEIHDEAVWDDGRPVTGNDYVFSLKALLNPRVAGAAPFRPYVALIKSVRVDPANPRRFTVLTDQTFIQGEEYVSNAFSIMPAHLYDPGNLLVDIPLEELTDPVRAEALAARDTRLQQFADQLNDPKYARDPQFVNGCGPYRLKQWETGQQIALVKKDNWWGDKLTDRFPILRAYPAELVYQPIPDATTTIAALKAEEIDVAANIDPNGFQELKDAPFTAERYNFHTPSTWAYFFIYVNTTNPKLSDKRVRQALAYAIDVQELVDNVYNGYGERLATPVPPSFSYASKDLEPYAFNIERARELLAAAGWQDSNNNGTADKVINGQLTELNLDLLITANRETSRSVALLIQDNARRAGINIVPVAQEGSVIQDNTRKRNYELAAAGRNYNSPLWNPKQSFHTLEGDNRTGFGNARTDALIDEILLTNDDDKRNDLYRQLQGIIYDEMPEIPLFTLTNRLAIHKRFDTEVTSLLPNYQPTLLELKERYRQN